MYATSAAERWDGSVGTAVMAGQLRADATTCRDGESIGSAALGMCTGKLT